MDLTNLSVVHVRARFILILLQAKNDIAYSPAPAPFSSLAPLTLTGSVGSGLSIGGSGLSWIPLSADSLVSLYLFSSSLLISFFWRHRLITYSKDKIQYHFAILFSFYVHLSSMSKSLDSESMPLLEDSIYNILHQLEKKADFLYSAVDKYMLDAQKDGKPELLKLWSTIKEDEQSHLKMLRDELVRETKEDKFR